MRLNLSSSVSRVFAASAIALTMTGCASVPPSKPEDCMDESKTSLLFLFSASKRTYNKDCAIDRVADQYSKSTDEGERLAGQILREGNDKRTKAAADNVRDAALPKDVECDVTAWKKVNGKIYIPLNACKKPAAAPEAGASAPAAPASAPAL